MLLSDAVQAVDALQLARPRRPLVADVDVGTRIPPPPDGVVRDSATLARLRRSIDAAMPPPDEVKPKSALRELLRTDDVYGIQKNLTVVPYVEEHLRIARRPLRPQDVATLVSPDAAEKIRDPYKWIVKDEASLVADCDSGKPLKPYWDPVLRSSRKHMLGFLKILHRSGLLTWRTRIRSRVGCFFVLKKDKISRRLVIDARVTNACHRRPPRSALAIPAALAELNFSDEALHLGDPLDDADGVPGLIDDPVELDELPAGFGAQPSGSADGDLEDPDDPCGFSIDLCDGFYQYTAEQVASWFGLDVVMTAADVCAEFELDGVPVLDELSGVVTVYSDLTLLEAAFAGLAMDWSWALYFCHDSLASSMMEAMREVGLPPILVGDRGRPAMVTRRRAAAAPYVDNGNVLAATPGSGARLHQAVIRVLRRRGFELHDEHVAERSFQFLGLVFSGGRRRLGHVPARSWRLFFATDDAARRAGLPGCVLRVLVGHLLHHFGTRTELFSILEACFWFVINNLDE